MIHRFDFKAVFIYMLYSFLFLMACKDNKSQIEDHPFTNDLINETSPYLLQHAHNPVNWIPWGDSVFKRATKEDKLVIISIGYSSCHWCHVMEIETFEDETVAEIMNNDFISIKVDREERPDVDQVYMTAVQLMTGNGGWPLNVIVLPNGKPIYGGTYHTNEQWKQVLQKINKLYKDDPKKANEYAGMVAKGVQDLNIIEVSDGTQILTPEALQEGVAQWEPNWDVQLGGNKGREKFMLPSNLNFLLEYATLLNDESSRSYVKTTLDQMARGGIYDHLGGGFYRYSTDPEWKIPHFEKMLYDNAQLISLYSRAYTIFKDQKYKQMVFGTIAFLQNEMRNPAGGYYAAIDADSEGEEGKYYVWEEHELKTIIETEYELFDAYYNISDGKKMEGDKIVLHKIVEDGLFSTQHKISLERLDGLKKRWKDKLSKVRNERTRPRIDDKIIVSWNALLINGYVNAYKAFGDQEHLNEAVSIFNTIKDSAYQNTQLVHSYKEGSKRLEGFLEDYANLCNASLNLYSASLDTQYLKFAQQLIQSTEMKFKDGSSEFYKFNSSNTLIANIIKNDDGVLPSPNAIMAQNLFLLGHIEYNKDYFAKSKAMLTAIQPLLRENAASYTHWGSLMLNNVFPYYEIAVVGTDAKKLTGKLNQIHIPNALIVGSSKDSTLPLFEGRYVEDSTYIYVCRDNTCKLPVNTIEGALEQLRNF